MPTDTDRHYYLEPRYRGGRYFSIENVQLDRGNAEEPPAWAPVLRVTGTPDAGDLDPGFSAIVDDETCVRLAVGLLAASKADGGPNGPLARDRVDLALTVLRPLVAWHDGPTDDGDPF
jgi:hypothetical protein